MTIPLDYDTLRLIWWALMGFLLVGFAVMDGFDLGIAALLPIVARSDAERRVALNVVGPVWEGNQVWIITGGGAIFAAWPTLYATSFSSLYLAMMLLLVAFILRPAGFKYRSKLADPTWRATWDGIICFAGVVIALVPGVAMGNLLLGLPFTFDALSLRPLWHGSFFGLFTPFTLLCGLVSVVMLSAHGAMLLAWRTEGDLARRARRLGAALAIASAALFAGAGLWVAQMAGHRVTSALTTSAVSDPLLKTVALAAGGWWSNFATWRWMWGAPIAGVAGVLLAAVLLAARAGPLAFAASSISIAGIVTTVGFALFPFVMPSSFDLRAGLTVWDASSSHMTLWIMLLATCFFMPLIMLYTAWVYRVIRGKVTDDSVAGNVNAY